ncbi:uncharacterized protein F5891DRAFT_1193560 [Suillus fuscotomentosus]|uniref:DUF6532 domain-containing protein n=1 Tax=Suillus fuscotomentosus TaxID=1912939 RepID=A0AAD4HGS8_9AGAM|nr:uncharacterized protein F5891DRAFT_1193560 [Suillus fuscotomentosus]KAG1895947.1 hypothetical protein F5891DRAFT_1193560 [Suillus fuscotomentosus]
MMEQYDDNEGEEEEEEEEARNDQHGSYREDHQPLPYNNLPQPHYRDPGAPQHYQPLPYYPQPDHDPIPQHYQPLPYYPLPQMQYDYLPPSSPPHDPRFHNQLSVPSSSQQPAPPPPPPSPDTYDYLPNVPMFEDLVPPGIQELEHTTRSRFRGLDRMRGEHLERQRARCAAQVGTNVPGIRTVFIYNPRCHPAESQRGQLITTGVIRPTSEVSVTAPIPSRRQLLAPITPSSPQPNADPGLRQLKDKELKDVKKEAKQVMRRKVLLENAMLTTEHNTEMAKEAFLEAVGRVVSGGSQRPDTRSLTDHRETTVALLLINHRYLFKDPTIMSPVNHPTVIETICNSLWTTHLHEALDFDELDKFDNLFSIGGTAVHNTLLEFQDGVYKSVQFSPASLSATEYKAIQTHNMIVRDTPTLHAASLSVKQNMIALGTALRAC